jgi:hypothetical protein
MITKKSPADCIPEILVSVKFYSLGLFKTGRLKSADGGLDDIERTQHDDQY